MDIFKFNSPTHPLLLEQGEVVNNVTSKMWVERYAQAGEFKLVANASSGMRELLPIGSIISHIDTTEVMIVENHEITEQKGQEPEITISGRGFETFFENRIVGSNKNFPTNTGVTDYSLGAGRTSEQVRQLIDAHITTGGLIDDASALPYVSVFNEVPYGTEANVARNLKRSTLYSSVLELLAVDSLGIKAVRPGTWAPLGVTGVNLSIIIHIGTDRSNEVIFSHDTGEIESADYLWSNKKLKNTAMVSGKWVETLVTTTATEYDRRMMYVSASDIDNSYSAAPTGTDLDSVVAAMQQRGNEALAAQVNIALAKAEISRDTNKSAYRKDFDVGDIITVHGNYNESTVMRISEYVEIEDENGSSGYPTLTTV